jgi:hypothetical protein
MPYANSRQFYRRSFPALLPVYDWNPVIDLRFHFPEKVEQELPGILDPQNTPKIH